MPAVMLLVFALTLFVSATLLFFIEPMVGKMMLPLLGGTPAVWNTCMVFFQAILLAGYAYAHWTTQWLGSRGQAKLQLAVLLLPFLAFAGNLALASGFLSPNQNLILGNEGDPIPALLLVLTISVGLPMAVVCTSAPLLQRWFASTDHPAAKDPYFLYGASNFGSIFMLLAYPMLVEPNLTIKNQQLFWVIGYGILTALVFVCAILMWRAKPALELAGMPTETPRQPPVDPAYQDKVKPAERGVMRARAAREAARESNEAAGPTIRPVTWTRRLRWLMLAVIPSSLMLGATTFITTDIAAIPLLWVLPLTLYLLTFIIVFAQISARTQSIVTLLGLGLLMGVTIVKIAPAFILDEKILWLVRLGGLLTFGFSLQLLRIRDNQLIHRVMVLVMPLLVLLLLFMILSDIRPGVVANILLHLATLFIISMVCHGELALDRPEPKHLTEFFLWMSVGGVVGGLFNALVAPKTFNSLVEYPLMMMIACLMLPPLGTGRSGTWARMADVALTGVFLLVGGLLLMMCYRDELPDLSPLKTGPWKWGITAILLGGALGVIAAWRGWGTPPAAPGEPEEDHWLDRLLDVALPAALMVLVLGLYWGLPAAGVRERLVGFSSRIKLDPKQFLVILKFGLPCVLCYTFVERSVRFGLGVGVIMLAAGFSNLVEDSPLYQERSFFGVLRVEEWTSRKDGYYYPSRRLVHGTTLHGMQLLQADIRDTPVTYYHKTGPVGQIMRTYNRDPKKPLAVIGLGTGSMAGYALPGQTLDFYDIDPVVVDIAYDTEEFFTYCQDAEERGVDINLILGDARLTFDPKNTKETKARLKPLNYEHGTAKPPRRFGPPLDTNFKYGFIVVDAFSSDAIPVHLITREAVQIYLNRLDEGGILLMHISNRYLDLQPVLANIADELGLTGYHMSDDDEDAGIAKTRSHWVALVRDKKHLQKVLEPIAWQRDTNQLAMLGLALWPSANPSVMTSSGLSYAFQALTEQQARMAAKYEGWKGDSKLTEGDWEPLDQPSYLAQRVALREEKLKEIEQLLKQLEEPLAKAKANGEVYTKPLDDVQKKIKDNQAEIKQVESEIAIGTADKTRLMKKLADLEKKKADLGNEEKDLQQKATSAKFSQEWLEGIKERLENRRDQHLNWSLDYVQEQIQTLDDEIKKVEGSSSKASELETLQKRKTRWVQRKKYTTEGKQETARRVGVWTDDYSNILSVFSW